MARDMGGKYDDPPRKVPAAFPWGFRMCVGIVSLSLGVSVVAKLREKQPQRYEEIRPAHTFGAWK